MTDVTRPLVVCDSSGAPVDVVMENEKGFRKSIETGTLWALHGETGRLLPYDERHQAAVEDRGSWYRATISLAEGSGRAPATAAADTVGSQARSPATNDGASLGAVLVSLAEVIRDRREKMPEGSYTTHLFSAGGEKVRKKTGEEAVELILSSSAQEMTSEAADLLYHLLVLLEYEHIPLDAVADELRRR